MPYFTNKDWEKDLEVCPYCGSELIEETSVTTSDDNLTKTSHMICYTCDERWQEQFSFTKRVALISG